jgi:Ca2+-transporting ATPase
MLKFIRYLIASNFDEILTVFVCVVFLGLRSPYTAIQILWINLVTDGLPAIALSVDPPFADIMREPPRKKDKGFMQDIYIFSIIAGALAFASSMIVFVPLAYIGEANIIVNESLPLVNKIAIVDAALASTPDWMKGFATVFTNENTLNFYKGGPSVEVWYSHGQTLNFTMSIVYEMFNVFITRSGFERSTFTMSPVNNPWLWGSIGLAMSLQMLALYVPMAPEAGINNGIFNTMPMNGPAWGIIVGICIIAAMLTELAKFIAGKYIMKSWVGRPKKTVKAAA